MRKHLTCAKEDSNQSAHLRSLLSLCCLHEETLHPYLKCIQWRFWSDFAGCTSGMYSDVMAHVFLVTCKVDEAWPWFFAYIEYNFKNGPRNLNAVPTVVCSMCSRSFLFTSKICSRLLKSLAWSFSGTRQLNRRGNSKNWKQKCRTVPLLHYCWFMWNTAALTEVERIHLKDFYFCQGRKNF